MMCNEGILCCTHGGVRTTYTHSDTLVGVHTEKKTCTCKYLSVFVYNIEVGDVHVHECNFILFRLLCTLNSSPVSPVLVVTAKISSMEQLEALVDTRRSQ